MSELYSDPWRKVSNGTVWNEEVFNSLKQKIATFDILEEADMENFNILLIGQVSAGKSSLFNTTETVFKDHVTSRAIVGRTEQSLTTKFKTFKIKVKDNKNQPICFRFCDSMGLEGGDDGLQVDGITRIIDGYVKDGAELSQGINPKSDHYNKTPGPADEMHCIAFIMEAESISMMDAGIVEKIKAIRKEANRRDKNPMVIMTKIDAVCDETRNDTSKAFLSKAVHEKVQEVSEKFGINENHIHPVRNYTKETEKDLGIDILMLLALQQIQRCSIDFVENLDN